MSEDLTFTDPLQPTVYTLGPQGTDAAHLASRLTKNVKLYNTFREAVEQSMEAHAFALVACGCLSESESWLDIHFESFGRIDLLHAFTTLTKPMCIARNPKVEISSKIATYRALRSLLRNLAPQYEPIWTKNKVEAVELCARSEVELCIGSLDVVANYPHLQIVRRFTPPMVWCLYGRKSAEASLLSNRATSLNAETEMEAMISE